MKSLVGKVSGIMVLAVIIIISFLVSIQVNAQNESQNLSETANRQNYSVDVTESVNISDSLNNIYQTSKIFNIPLPEENNAAKLFNIKLPPSLTVLTANASTNPVMKGQSTVLWCDYRSIDNSTILNANVTFEIEKNNFAASFNPLTQRYEYNYTSNRAGEITVYCNASAENFENASSSFGLTTTKTSKTSRFVAELKNVKVKLLKEDKEVDLGDIENGVYTAEIEITQRAWATINGLNIADDTNIIAQADDLKPTNAIENKILTPVFSLNDSDITFDNVEITLEKRGEISNILRCDNWNFNDFKCDSNWISTNILFEQNSTHVWFTVKAFSAYAGASITIINPYTFVRDNENWTVAFNTTGQADLIINSTNANWTELLTDNNSTADEMKFLDITCGNISLKNFLKVIDENRNYYDYSQLTENDSIRVKKLLIENYSCDEIGYLTNFMYKAGYATLEFSFGDQTAYAYDTSTWTEACGPTVSGECGDMYDDCDSGTAALCRVFNCVNNCTARGNASLTGSCSGFTKGGCNACVGINPDKICNGGTPTCSGGSGDCTYTCNGNYSNCDSNNANGCECNTGATCTGTCGIFPGCSVSQNSCDASCTNNVFNPDSSSGNCSVCLGSGHWDIGGDYQSGGSPCCGDDNAEGLVTETGGGDAPSGFNTGETTCCIDTKVDGCAHNDVCYEQGSVTGTPPNKAYCYNSGVSVWVGGDNSSGACSNIGGNWITSLGTMTGSNSSCCGDDTSGDIFATYNGSLSGNTVVNCDRCNAGSHNPSQPTIYYGHGYYCSTSTTRTCFYGDVSCSYDVGSNGTSNTCYGNGYLIGTTCYYGSMGACNPGSACANGTTCTLACSGSSWCCPSQSQYTSGVSCTGSSSTCSGTTVDRDTSSSACTASGNSCTAYTWINSMCCGDDSSEYIVSKACAPGVCTNNTNDKSCCSATTSCVNNSVCYANSATADVNGDGLNEKCSSGAWIDVTPPNSSFVSPTPNPSSWQKTNFIVNVTDSDMGGSGLANCYYKIRNDTTWTSWISRTCNLTSGITVYVGASGNCTVQGSDTCEFKVNASDNAGNSNVTSRNFSIDYTAPQYSLNSTNSTQAGTPILFSLNWTDNFGLSSAITSLWNGTSWVNASSWCNSTSGFTGTVAWCNQTLVVNSTPQLLWWKQYANDTSNNWNTSQNFSLDTQPPQYSSSSTNSSRAGTLIEFRLNWSDNLGLSSYMFYLDNCTGNFVNVLNGTFTGLTNWSNVTQVINSTNFCTIRWNISANDTSNNWNNSANFSFVTVPPPCDKDISSLPYTIDQSNTYYCLVSNFNPSGNGVTFAQGVQNSTLNGEGFYINGSTSTYTGVNVSGSNVNNTIENIIITKFKYGIYINSSSNNNLTNNTITSNSISVYLNSTSNNTISIGSIDSSTDYDYYLSNTSLPDNFISTNFTTRKIGFADATSWFSYNNYTNWSSTLYTNLSSPANLTRKLIWWDIINITPTLKYDIMFNDSASSSVNATYNFTNLINSTGNLMQDRIFLVIINNSLAYRIDTGNAGQINFTTSLSPADTNIYIKYPHPPKWSNPQSWSPSTYSNTTPSQFNVTWTESVNGMKQANISIWNSSGYVLVNNASMTNQSVIGTDPTNWTYSMILPIGTWYWNSYAFDIDQPYSDSNVTDNYTVVIGQANAAPVIQQVMLKTENLGGNEAYTLIANYSGCSIDCQNYTINDTSSWNFGGWGQQISFDNTSLVLNLTSDISFPFSKNLTITDIEGLNATYNITLNLNASYYQNETGTTNRTYQLIARNTTWSNNAPAGYPINITWNFSSPSGSQGNLTVQNGIFNLSPSINQTNKVVWYGDWINETNETWKQDPTKTTVANGTAYVTHDIWLNNSWNFTINNLNITEYLIDRNGWSCNKITTLISVNTGNNTYNQSINCSANNIILGFQTQWAQNTSAQSNTSIQYINTTVNLTSNDTINYANVNYTHPYPCPNNFTCSGFPNSANYTVNTSGNVTYYSGSGNVITATNTTWSQDASRTSTETLQYINYTVNLNRNDTSPSINFTNVYYPTASNCPSNFSALGSSVPNNYTVTISGNISIYNCSGNVINTANVPWAQNTTNTSQTIDSQNINETIRLSRNDTGPSNSIVFNNISYTVPGVCYCLGGFTCYPANPESVTSWYVPSGGNLTIFKAYGNGITNTPSGWQQNSTAQSSVSNVYLNQSLYLENIESFALSSLSYSSSDWPCSGTCTSNCPNGFTCSGMSGNVSFSPQQAQTIWSGASGNVINESQTNWSQNTSATSNLSIQYINSTVNLTRIDGSTLTFVNINYSIMQCPSNSSSSSPTNYTVPTSGNLTYLACSGDNITESWIGWQQDWIRTTLANSTAYATRNITIQNNATNSYLNFTNIQTNWQNQNRSSPWTCSGTDTISINYNSWNNISMIMNCSAQNIIQPVNTSGWIQDNSSVTVAGGSAYVKGKSYFNNTDTLSYTNVVTNSSSYHNATLRRNSTWNCSWNSSLTENLNFNTGQTNQTSGYSVLCNQNNTITKTNQPWTSDNSTEQNLTKQWIIRKVNGTNTDPNISYVNVNYTIFEFPNCKNGYTCNVTSENITVSNGTDWTRWINASNSSVIINTTWTNRYAAPEYYQNITINDTGDITFYNLTAWTLNFNDSNITAGTDYIKYWNGTQWIDITPTSNDTNCNTSSPVYTANSTINGTFYVCKKDTNGNGKIDYFKFKIPHTSVQVLQVGGNDATYPTYNNNGTNTTIPNYGKAVLIYANWSDDVALSKAWLWTNETGGSGRNYTDGTYNSTFNFSSNPQWSNFTWQNASILPTTSISWKIYVNDTSGNQNVTQGSFRIWGWANVTEIDISNLYSVNRLNRTVSAVTCRVMDANFSTPLENYNVSFYKNNTLQNTSLTNSSGYVVWYYNSTPDLGPYVLKCNITDDSTTFYNKSSNQLNSTVYVWRQLYMSLDVNPAQIYRNVSFQPHVSNLLAHLYDDNSANLQSVQANFYRSYPSSVLDYLGYQLTNSTGYASYSYDADSLNDNSGDWPPQNYTIYTNHSVLDYSYNISNVTYIEIRGKLYPDITSPSNGDKYHKSQAINLNSITNDEYVNAVTPDSKNWSLVETNELINQSENGQWNISVNHILGNFTVNYSVSKNWYESNWTTKNISIFGYAAVNETGSNLIYRGLPSNYTGTVYDYSNGSVIANHTCNWWLNNTNQQNITTNSSGNCMWNLTTTCSNSAGPYFVNVSIGNNTSLFYDASSSSIASILINLTGNLSTSISSPSSNSVWHRGDSIPVNSSVTDDCGNNFNDSNASAKWYLDSLNANGINSTISIPIDYSKGQKTLITNATSNYYVLGTNSNNIYIYGWANVTNITPNSETVPRGTIITVTCHVEDSNTSENLGVYPVSFYKNDNLQNTTLTDSDGYASWDWNTVSDDAGINYSIKCNISDNETLFYNKSYPYEQNTTIGLSSGINIDTITKDRDTISRNDSYGYYANPYYEALITVHAKEAALGDSNNSNVSFYNSTNFLGNCMTNETGYCNMTFDPPDDTTPQNYTIYINATKSGYSPSQTNQTWVEVRGSIPNSNVNIIYPPASPKLKLYRGDSSWFNSSITDENNQPLVGATVNWRNSSFSGYLIAGPNLTDSSGNGNSYGTIPINHPLGDSISIYEFVTKTYFDSPSPTPYRQIKAWGWSNVSILQPTSGNINRGDIVNILCRVTDANTSESLSDYRISFWNDSTNVYNSNSNSTGYSNYSWDTSYVSVGPHVLNCTVPQNSTKFYDGAFNISSVNVTLIGNLTASGSASQSAIYRNDSWAQQNGKPYTSDVIAHISDEYSNSVANANVSFYQNDSLLGYCPNLTDSFGNCTYTYNPLDSLAVDSYSIKFNATAQYYYDSNTVETVIDVKGKLFSNIDSYPTKMYRTETYLINSTTIDENGNYVSPVTGDWRISGTFISSAENTSYTVPLNKNLGNYHFDYFASKPPYYDTSDTATQNTQIWSKVNTTLYSPLGATYNRGSSITYYANVTDVYNSSPVSNYNCSWLLDGLNVGNSLTDSQGTCNFTWSTGCSNFTKDYAGLHTINTTIASNLTRFYDANINESDTNTIIEGSLNIRIGSPLNNSVWHKTDSVWLNSTVNSECPSEIVTNLSVNWTLNISQIGTGVNTSWSISQNQNLGSYVINSSANKTYYNSTFNTSNIQIWGWSNISWIYPANNTEGHGQVLQMTCRVLDANNSTGISGYNVSFWKNGIYNGSNMTISDGNATMSWDTSEGLGSYAWKCNITDNSTLYYNRSTYEATYNVNVTDSISPRVENLTVSPSTLEASYNSTNITVDVWDSVQRDKVWANIKGPSYNQNISMTYLSGNTFNLTFTPVQGGLHNVTIYANDSSNNANYTQGNFTSIGNTTGMILQLPQSETASGITTNNNYTFLINVTLNNTENGTMRFVNLSLTLPSSGFFSNSTFVQCPTNITPGSNCTTTFSINVTNQANLYTNYIDANATWQNPDYSTSYSTNRTTVTVQPNPILQLNKHLIEDNITHGTTKTVGNYTIQNIGNSPLSSIVTTNSGNLSSSWITYVPSSVTDLTRGSSQLIKLNVTIPANQSAGRYMTNITVNATGSSCSPLSNCWDSLILNVSVQEDWNWTQTPTELNLSVPTGTPSGSFNVTLNNTGNMNINLVLGMSGSGANLITSPTLPYSTIVYNVSSNNITFSYSTTGVSGGIYTLNITFTNSSANPTENQTYVIFNVTDPPPQINNPSVLPSIVDVNYSSVLIQASIQDNLGNNYAWINITKPDGITYIITKDASTQNPYPLSEYYTPSQTGIYYVRIYANDTQSISAGTNYSDLFNFTSVGNTSVAINSNATSATVNSITQDSSSSFALNISVNNTGQSGAYYTNQTFELPSGWTSSNNFTYNNLTSGSYRSNVSTITVPKQTNSGLYYVNATVIWLNPNNTVSINKTTITVNVTSNPILNITQNSISMILNHDSSNSTNFTLNSTGNTPVTSILINCTSGNCSDMNISFTPNSISSLNPMSSANVTVNASAYLGFPAGNYSLTINASGTGTSSTVSLNITVPENRTWNRTPDGFSQPTVGLNSVGSIGVITINNTGNVNTFFNITTSGNGTGNITTNVSNLTVNPQSQGYVGIIYTTASDITESEEIRAINISITNSSASPSALNTSASIRVIAFKVNITSPTQSNQTSVRTGDNITVNVNATYGGTILTENLTWNVTINSTACPISNYAYNSVWEINCTAPSLIDAINYTLTVTGNYTTYNALATDSESNAIYYTDITPPSIIPYVSSIPIGSNASIRANITDNLAVSKAIAEITHPNSTKQNFTMSNISLTTWEYNLTNVFYGDYDVKVYANDTTNNWNNNTTWFEAYDPLLALFNGTALDAVNNPISITFNLYRPSTATKLYNFSSNASGNYSQQINKRYYDFNILEFNNTINLTNVSITTNTSNSILSDNIPVSQIGSGTRISKAIYVQTILNYTNALLVLNYSGTSYTAENYLGIYRCSNWAFSTRNCTSGWNRISSTLSTSLKTLTLSTTDLSGAYAAAEFICGDGICETTYGESNAVCPTDCPSSSVTQGTGGGGGGGGGVGGVVTPPSEEVTPLSLSTSLIEVRLYPGEYQLSSIAITNNKKEDADVSLNVEGDIWPFTLFENDKLTIKSKQTEYAKVKFFTMLTTTPGIYNGNIIVRTGDTTQNVSVILRVEYQREKLLDVKVDPITKDVYPGDKLKYLVTLYNLGLTKRVDVFINYTVRSIENDTTIAVSGETVALETSLSFERSILIPNDTIPAAYSIEAVASYEDNNETKQASSIASFNVIKPFWLIPIIWSLFTSWIFYVILFILLPSIYLTKKLYEKMRMKRVYRARYVKPVDITKLPRKGLYVGKIAETNVNAYINPDDLTTHLIVAGGTGAGKSVAAMIIAEELLKRGVPVVVFDPTAQWTGFIRPCTDNRMLNLYHKFGFKKEDAKSFKGTIIQITDPFMKVEIEKFIKKGEITVILLNKLTPDQLDYFVRKTIDYMFTIQWPESRDLKLLMVYDEVHRLLPKYAKRKMSPLEGGGYIALERGVREFRKWGIGLVMISQVLLDFKGAIRAVIATEAQLRTKYEGDINRIRTKYGWQYSSSIPKLEIGTGLIQNPSYNNGKPWFISFRPLLHDTFSISNKELETYDKFRSEIEGLRKQVEELKNKKTDTYDMELEISLADEKTKVGQLKMAETYIESAKSRIEAAEKRRR